MSKKLPRLMSKDSEEMPKRRFTPMYLPCTTSLSCSSLQPLPLGTPSQDWVHKKGSARTSWDTVLRYQKNLPGASWDTFLPRKTKGAFSKFSVLPRIGSRTGDGLRATDGTPKRSWKQTSHKILAACYWMAPYLPSAAVSGISRQQLIRPVVRFSRPPVLRPFTLVLHQPGTALTHVQVLRILKDALRDVTDGDVRVVSLQYVERNVMLASRGEDHRWLVTLSSGEALDHLLAWGSKGPRVAIGTERTCQVAVWRYDEVARGEYNDYKRHRLLMRQIQQAELEEVTKNNK